GGGGGAGGRVGVYGGGGGVAWVEPLEVLRADPRILGPRTHVGLLVGLWLVVVAIAGTALALEVQLKSSFWGNVGSTLWLASAIVIAVPLVHASARLLGRALARLFGPEG